MAARVDWVAGDWVAGGVVGGKDGAGAGIWVYWRYFDWVDRVGDWGMDFYATGDWAREYVFIFAGGGYGWGGVAGVDCAFVFWREELGEEKSSHRVHRGRSAGGHREEKSKTPGAKPAPGAPIKRKKRRQRKAAPTL